MSSSFIIQKGPGIASKAYNYAKKLITGGPKVSPTITSVAPKFPKNKIQAAIRDVHKTALVTKGKMKKKSLSLDRDIQKVKSKLGQSMQKLKGEKVTESGVSKGKDLREKKMGGGMMGRRFGMKKGSKKFPDLTGDGKVTFADILKGRGVINGKKKGKA